MDQMACPAKYHAAVVLALDHVRLPARIAVDFQRHFLSKLVLPLLFLLVVVEVTLRAVRIDVLIIVGRTDRLFGNRLMVVQTESIAISHILRAVICVVHMGNRHRHKASAGRHIASDQDQVSVAVIDMHRSGTACVLAVIAPVVLQTGVVHVRQADVRTHLLEAVMAVGGEEFGVTGKLIRILYHQSIVATIDVPVLHKIGNVERHVFNLVACIGQAIFHGLVTGRTVVPVQRRRRPALFHAVHFDRAGLLVLRQGHHHKMCADQHITGLQLRKPELQEAALDVIASHRFQINTVLIIGSIVEVVHMGILDLLPF